ncbi:ArnT family glycosyltransferase [Nocardia sp. CDC160]|uniref:ArnT family glycosyltransferase n=1 Tax=Nocardia sp. CDC160 TaxID=3112166 RepID=UPI002DB82AC7|nr:glycosyl transferase family 39 [Nocardia sp. CDC160]MEC3913177.1 glycosyl transferase family 39 [Nocardia sp. CDC160]
MVLNAAAPAVDLEEPSPPRPSFATVWILLLAALSGTFLAIPTLRYDYFGDELYFVAAGAHRSLTYADQGVLIPLIAHLADTVAPGSPPVLRLPAVLMMVGAVVISAAVAYELGGGRTAQMLAAAAYGVSPLAATQAVQLSTFSFDATLQAAIIWLVIRWIRTRDDRLLTAIGVIAAIDLQVKWFIPTILLCLAGGVLVAGPRQVLWRPALWNGIAIFALSAVPGLWWQNSHGWPALAMSKVIGAEQDAAGGGPLACIPQMIGLAGLLGGLLAGWSFWCLARQRWLRPYLFMLVASGLLVAVVLIGHGRPYYTAGFLPVLFGIGAASLPYSVNDRGGRLLRRIAAPILVLSLAIITTLVITLPQPPSRAHGAIRTQADFAMRTSIYGYSGWSELTAKAADAYRQLPESGRPKAIIAQNYWQAAALQNFGRDYDLPPIYSPNRGFGYFGPPPSDAGAVLYVGLGSAEQTLRRQFDSVSVVERLNVPNGFPGVNSDIAIFACRGPVRPWSELWPEMMDLRLPLGI